MKIVLCATFIAAASITAAAQHSRLYPPTELAALEGPDRQDWQQPERIMDALRIGEGSVVADLGAGGVRDTLIGCESVTGPSPPAGAPGPSGTQPALGVPGIVTVLAPGVATATDLTPPRATLRVTARQRLRTARIRGIRLRIGCAEACGISAALSINRTAAKRLGLAGRTGGAVLGTATARKSRAGALRLRVRLTRRARSALRRSRRQTVTVQVLVSDASGNGTLLQHRIQLVR